jgi:hypothetical protein
MLLVSGAAQSIEAYEFWLSVELAMSTELFGGENWWKFLDDFPLSIILIGRDRKTWLAYFPSPMSHRPWWISNFTNPSSRIFNRSDWQTS